MMANIMPYSKFCWSSRHYRTCVIFFAFFQCSMHCWIMGFQQNNLKKTSDTRLKSVQVNPHLVLLDVRSYMDFPQTDILDFPFTYSFIENLGGNSKSSLLVLYI